MTRTGLPVVPKLSTDVHTGDCPAVSPAPDIALLREQVIQDALQLAASGAWDADTLAAHEGLLPEEVQIVARVARVTAENPVHKRSAEALNVTGAFELLYGDGTNRDALTAELTRLKKLIRGETRKRAEGVAVLTGEQLYAGGAAFTGDVPPAPVVDFERNSSVGRVRVQLALRSARLSRFFVDFGATIASLGIESAVISGPVALATRSDDPIHALAYSISGVLLATVLPHFFGTAAAVLLKGAKLTWRKSASLFFAAPWMVAVFLLATLRTQYAEQSQRTVLALSQRVAPAQVNLAGHFDWNSQLALWFALMLGTGLAIIAIKIGAYNPALTSVVKHDNVIAILRYQRAPLLAAKRLLGEKSDAQKQIGTMVTDQYDHFEKKVLPAVEAELLSLFRVTFVKALADLEATGVLAASQPTHARLSAVRGAQATEGTAA